MNKQEHAAQQAAMYARQQAEGMRKDNELLILANGWPPGVCKKRADSWKDLARNKRTEPHRPLTGHFSDYLTEIDVSSPCEVLPEAYQNSIDRKAVSKGGFTPEIMAKLRPWWEKLDADQEWIDKTEKDLF